MLSFGWACPESGPTGEKSAVQIGTELLLHDTSHTVSMASVPCQRGGRTFLDYKVRTRPETCGFQVQKQSCTLGNFLVNLGNFLYLLHHPSCAQLQSCYLMP
jgi:hypothetical protein